MLLLLGSPTTQSLHGDIIMATPAEKSPELEKLLEEISGRTTAIKADVCIPVPLGCGGPAKEFRDHISCKEYTISGLCQKCQDSIF